MDCVDVINPNPPLEVVDHPERMCNDDVNAPIPEHENDDGTDPKSIQFVLHALSKCLLQLLSNNLSVVEGDLANQSLLTQVANPSMVEEGHPSVKILPQIAVYLNQRNPISVTVLPSHR
jgi:hypothetical protein